MQKTKFAQKYIEHKKSNFKHTPDYPAMFYKSKLRAFFTILKSDIKQFNSHRHPYDITNAYPRILTHDLDCLISILESILSYCKYLRKYVSK